MGAIHKILRTYVKVPVVLGVAMALLLTMGVGYVYAETYPGGSNNGKTSRLKQLSGDLGTLGHGSTSNSPDWGADWNQIATASKWVPNGNLTASDVAKGKKFYSGNRTEQTGTRVLAGPCPTQTIPDGYDGANPTDNCVLEWEVASPAILGDDKKDPRTNVVWSKCLKNIDDNTTFSSDGYGCTIYSWDASSSTNHGRTAAQLCSDRGNGWRLPTQKETLQAYIDGAYYRLLTPTVSAWTSTVYAGLYPIVAFTGYPNYSYYTASSSVNINCVR